MRYLIASMTLVVLALSLYADDFCRQRVVTYNAHQVQAVQHHSYQPGYQFNHNPQALFYYDVDSHYRDKLLLDAIELRILKAVQSKPQYIPVQPVQQPPQQVQSDLRPVLEQLLRQMQSSQQIEASVKVNGKTVSGTQSGAVTDGSGGEQIPPPGSVSGGVPAGLQELANAKCVRCHAGGNRMDLRDLSRLSAVQRFDAWERVNSGNMPKNGTPIPDAEEKLFRSWATSSIR